jgi:hypothetical protein
VGITRSNTRVKKEKTTFVHKELSPFDIFADLKLGFYSLWYGLTHDEETSEKLAWGKLSEGQVIYKKGIEIFEDEICIEALLRSVHKL